jgi:LL-diaminopimelate aminotransferase
VVPKKLVAYYAAGAAHPVHALWNRRHTNIFNGVSYPVLKAAAAIFTPEGQAEVKAMTDFYLANAALIRSAMSGLGFSCIGGDNAPYIWVNTGTDSWAFFDKLLNEAQVVCTPGAGFGKCGEGHVRISAFNSRENVEKALARIAAALR